MPRKTRHIVAGIAWVIGSLVAWVILCSVFSSVVFMYLGNERQVKLPDEIVAAYNRTAVAGIVVIPAVVALLAMRSKLPGTGERSPRPRGFPIEPSGTA